MKRHQWHGVYLCTMWVCVVLQECCRQPAAGSPTVTRRDSLLLPLCPSCAGWLARSLARSFDSILKLYCRGPFVLATTRPSQYMCFVTMYVTAYIHSYMDHITYLSGGRAEVSFVVVSSRSCLRRTSTARYANFLV